MYFLFCWFFLIPLQVEAEAILWATQLAEDLGLVVGQFALKSIIFKTFTFFYLLFGGTFSRRTRPHPGKSKLKMTYKFSNKLLVLKRYYYLNKFSCKVYFLTAPNRSKWYNIITLKEKILALKILLSHLQLVCGI